MQTQAQNILRRDDIGSNALTSDERCFARLSESGQAALKKAATVRNGRAVRAFRISAEDEAILADHGDWIMVANKKGWKSQIVHVNGKVWAI